MLEQNDAHGDASLAAFGNNVNRRGPVIAAVIWLYQMANLKQISIRTLLAATASIAIFVAFASKPVTRYPHGTSWVKDASGKTATIQWTRKASRSGEIGDLLYAIIIHPDVLCTTATSNGSSHLGVGDEGVFRIANLPDSIWLNGQQLPIPENCVFFAIRKDGATCPIDVDLKKINEVCTEGVSRGILCVLRASAFCYFWTAGFVLGFGRMFRLKLVLRTRTNFPISFDIPLAIQNSSCRNGLNGYRTVYYL